MGGMAAQIPVKNDEAANAEAFAKVKADKEREATQGHDGTWVAHPGLVAVAKEAFDRLMPAPNQIATKKREDVVVTAADLLQFEPEAPITERGLRLNINVAIQYVGAWLVGQGAVPIYNLMEDAATAEISRSQVWQWIRSPKGRLDDGRKVTKEMVAAMVPEELAKIREPLGDAYAAGKYDYAAGIFADLVAQRHFRRVPRYAPRLRADRLMHMPAVPASRCVRIAGMRSAFGPALPRRRGPVDYRIDGLVANRKNGGAALGTSGHNGGPRGSDE